jgi:outer membrane protein assembly factor BamB
MAWKRIAGVESAGGTFDARATDDGWVLRGFDRIVGWDGRSDAPSWQIQLPKDDLMSCKLLAEAGGVLAAISDPGKGGAEMIGFRPDGTEAWRTALGVRVEQRGLAAAGGRFWAVGGTGKKRELLAIDPKSGKVADRIAAPGDQIAGAGDLLVIAGKDGIWCLTQGGPERVFEATNAGELLVDGTDVYFYFEDPAEDYAPTIGRLDGRTGKVTATLVTPDDVEEGPCRPLARLGSGVVVALGAGLGVGLFDLDKGKVGWRTLAEPGVMVGRSGVADGVLVCALSGSKQARLAAVDAKGAAAAAPAAQAKDASYALPVGGDVLVGGAKLVERFSWSRP